MSEQERVLALEAELEELRAKLSARDHALAELGERLQPMEEARELGASAERARRREAEFELTRFKSSKLYRWLLRPWDLAYRVRRRIRGEAR